MFPMSSRHSGLFSKLTTIGIWNYRNRCDCGAYLNATGRDAKVIIYTRNGTHEARHAEYRYKSRNWLLKMYAYI